MQEINLWTPEVFFILQGQTIVHLGPEDIKTFESKPFTGWRS